MFLEVLSLGFVLLEVQSKGLVIMYISFHEGMFFRKCSLRNLLRFYSEGNIIRSFWSFINRVLVSVRGSSLAWICSLGSSIRTNSQRQGHLVPSGGPVWLRRIYPKIIWLPKWSETGTFWSYLAALCGCESSIRSSLMMEFYWAVYNYISKVLLDVYSPVFS